MPWYMVLLYSQTINIKTTRLQHTYIIISQLRRKLAKPGGAALLNRKYFYDKKLKSYGALLKLGGVATP